MHCTFQNPLEMFERFLCTGSTAQNQRSLQSVYTAVQNTDARVDWVLVSDKQFYDQAGREARMKPSLYREKYQWSQWKTFFPWSSPPSSTVNPHFCRQSIWYKQQRSRIPPPQWPGAWQSIGRQSCYSQNKLVIGWMSDSPGAPLRYDYFASVKIYERFPLFQSNTCRTGTLLGL